MRSNNITAKMKRMQKKAQVEIAAKTIYLGISAILLSILVLGLVLLLWNYRGELTKTPPLLESMISSARFTDSPKCLAYQDPATERAYPKLIDLARFKNEIIAECYSSDTTKDYQFQLKLKNLDKNTEYTIQTAEWYNVPAFTTIEPVLIKQEDGIYNGQLLIIVQKPI